MAKNVIVAGELYESITGQLFEIGRQLRQPNGYPFDPEKLKKHLQAGIEGRFKKEEEKSIFPIWKTITIGGKSDKQLLDELKKGDFEVSDWAKDIMSKDAFTMASNPVEISLVRIKVRDLGFTENPTTTQIFIKAQELGLKLCPAETGPYLRLAFNDQLLSDYYWVAMEPIIGSDGDPGVFHVKRYDDGGRWLDVIYASPESHWHLGHEVVFLGK